MCRIFISSAWSGAIVDERSKNNTAKGRGAQSAKVRTRLPRQAGRKADRQLAWLVLHLGDSWK